ncbi:MULTISPECIES: TonB-dependent receptor [unclassified Brevundimonas]|uniref:TonB-dependent receptor n=1 Tax=unclassified Brevundimonas TaxID=2622653 RepID=UPI001304D38B|nr:MULTISPECIES: TonB-dependent receptor [unclassified Brevundimonas]
MRYKYLMLLASSSLTLGSAAHAQTAQQDPAADTPVTSVGEVLVTARKRTERLQDVPISVNVTSGEELASQDVRNLEALSGSVPNLHIQATPGNNAIYIRGIGSSPGNLAFEQSVGLFVDGAYAGRGRQFAAPFLDVASVEVLRGAQGALFGKNTAAGAINITSNGPRATRELATTVTGTIDGDNGYEITQIVSGPITDKLLVRLAGKYSDNEGWLENTSTGDHNPGREDLIGRAVIDYLASDTLSFRLKVEGASQDLTGQPMSSVAPGGAKSFTRATTPGVADFDNANSFNSVLTINKDFANGVTLTAITAYSAFDYDKQIDSDFTINPLLRTTFQEDFNQVSQEVRLTSPNDGALTWIVGAYAHRNEIDMHQNTGILMGPFNGASDRLFNQTDESYSLYGQATYALNDQWKLTAGLRQTWEDKAADQTRATTGAVPPSWVNTPLSGQRKESQLDPSVQVQYVLDRNTMFYASYAKGSKAGGFVGAQSTGDQTSFEFEGETSQSLEIGTKLTLLDGRATLNLAAYTSKFEDLQVSGFNAATNAFITSNAASAKSQGVEAEGTLRLHPSVTLSGSIAYNDAKYDSYPTAPCVYNNGVAPPANCVQDIGGTRLPRAPKWSGALTLNVDHPLDNGMRVQADATVRGRSGTYLEENLNPRSYQEGFSKVDLRLGLVSADDRWTLALIGRNITDEWTASHSFGTPFLAGSQTYVVDPGRVVSIQLGLRY